MRWKPYIGTIIVILWVVGFGFWVKCGEEQAGPVQSGSKDPVQSGSVEKAQPKTIEVTQSGSTPKRVEVPRDIIEPSRGFDPNMWVKYRRLDMRASAYTLSEQSCGKPRTAPGYGMTATGTRAKAFRTVSVDPNVIPLGSELYIDFPGSAFDNMDGVYIAEDTGGGVNGNEIDVFFGEDKPGQAIVENEALVFGRQTVTVYIKED